MFDVADVGVHTGKLDQEFLDELDAWDHGRWVRQVVAIRTVLVLREVFPPVLYDPIRSDPMIRSNAALVGCHLIPFRLVLLFVGSHLPSLVPDQRRRFRDLFMAVAIQFIKTVTAVDSSWLPELVPAYFSSAASSTAGSNATPPQKAD